MYALRKQAEMKNKFPIIVPKPMDETVISCKHTPEKKNMQNKLSRVKFGDKETSDVYLCVWAV